MKITSEDLTPEHKSRLTLCFKAMQSFFSEYSFPDLYLFRSLHRYQLLEYNDRLFISGITRKGESYIMPTEEPSENYFQTMKYVLESGGIDSIYPIPESDLQFYEGKGGQISFSDEESDYLFKIDKLKNYPGRRLSKKRNLVKQLLENDSVRCETLSERNLESAQTVLDLWQREHEMKSNDNILERDRATDFLECSEALKNFELLGLNGRILLINEQPVGFMAGNAINPRCFAIHFGKALVSIKGAYQFLLQDFAETRDSGCEWINLEQDLGIPELRKAKHSYAPDLLLQKWRVRLKF